MDIPDAIKIRQFFVTSEMPPDKRAMVLMSAGSVYDWKKVKDKLDTLYPLPVKKRGNNTAWKPHWKPKTASETSIDSGIDPLMKECEDIDSTELPDELQKELRESLSTYKQNRDRQQSAVKARGSYTGKGKTGGTGKLLKV